MATPSLTSVSPTSFPSDANNHTMQLFGSNFQSGDTLTFTDPQGNVFTSIATKLTVISSTEIDYLFNDGSDAGAWSVRVNSADGLLHSSTDAFTVAAQTTSNNPPIVTVTNQTVAAGTVIQMRQIFLWFDPDAGDSVTGFSVQDRTAGGGHLFLNGVQQADNNVFGNTATGIPISQIGQWTFVAGPSSSVDTIGFNAIDSHNAFNSPSATATVTAQAATNQAPVISGASTLNFQINQTIAASQFYTSAIDQDGSVATIRFWDSTAGTGHFTLDGIQISGGFVDIAPAQISRVAYVTGPNTGNNDIVVEAFDNLGSSSNDLAVHIDITAPGANQAPTLTGASSLSFATNQTIAGSQLYTSATDLDGSVATIQFWDSTVGAGHFTLDGVPISSSHVDVPPGQLGRVAYVTGSTAGTNDIVINAVDNQGLSSRDLSVHLVIGGGGNQAPVISGPTHLIFPTSTQLSSSQLVLSAHDPDGTIDHYTFSDSTPGDGFLTFDGTKISGASVSVSAFDLNRVGYRAGTIDGGTNTIAIQAFDNNGQPGNSLEMVIDVANSQSAIQAHQFVPVDSSSFSPDQQQMIAEFKSVSEDLGSSFVDALGQLSGDWGPVAQFVHANPDHVRDLLSGGDTEVFFEETADSKLLENLGTGIDAALAFKNVFADIAQQRPTGQIVTDTIVGANDFAISYGSGVIGAYVAGGVTAYAVGQTGGLLLPLAPVIFATTDFAVSWGTSQLLETAESIVKQSWLDPTPAPWSYDPTTGAFASLQTTDPATWQATAIRLSLDTGSPTPLTVTGDPDGIIQDDFLVGARGDDHVSGRGGADVLFGMAGDDALSGGPGNDAIDGGTGFDTAVFSGLRSAYTITHIGNSLQISGPDGLDTLTNIERLAFDDVTVPSGLPSAPDDFNGDSKSDLLFVNNTNHGLAIWQMDGTQITANPQIGTINAAAGWHYTGIGDFNGDGKTDLLFLNDATHGVAEWQMDGTQVTASPQVGTINAAAGWSYADSGDFNGDGKTDLLFLNSITNGVAIWQMNGTQVAANPQVGTITSGWHYADKGDFNGDGKTDLLMLNDTTHGVAIWQMDGTQLTANPQIGTINAAAGWHFTDVGDFNGDGKSDLLFLNDSTHGVAIWQMDGAQVTANPQVATINAAAGWHYDALRDFNGDGKTDLLFENDATHGVAVWLMNGTQITANPQIGVINAAADWHLIS
jgi:hypothetical protein